MKRPFRRPLFTSSCAAGFVEAQEWGRLFPCPHAVPARPTPGGREASLVQKRRLISSGAAESQRSGQSPAPQVTPVPCGPGRGRTAPKHQPPAPCPVLRRRGPPALRLALQSAVALPPGLGSVSQRRPRYPGAASSGTLRPLPASLSPLPDQPGRWKRGWQKTAGVAVMSLPYGSFSPSPTSRTQWDNVWGEH